jgi:hypothetical protein
MGVKERLAGKTPPAAPPTDMSTPSDNPAAIIRRYATAFWMAEERIRRIERGDQPAA